MNSFMRSVSFYMQHVIVQLESLKIHKIRDKNFSPDSNEIQRSVLNVLMFLLVNVDCMFVCGGKCLCVTINLH